MKTKLIVIIIVGIIVSGIFGTLFYLDQPKTPWDCRMKHGKVKEAIQDCLDRLQITKPKTLEIFHNNQPV